MDILTYQNNLCCEVAVNVREVFQNVEHIKETCSDESQLGKLRTLLIWLSRNLHSPL